MNNKVLYQLKSLEKIIIRNLLKDEEDHVLNCNNDLASLTPTQMQIVEYILNHNNEEIYQKDLENVLNLRRATVSGVLQTMEKNKLIDRIIDNDDSRTKKIILNIKAKEIFNKNIKRLEELEKIATQNIPQDELEIFSKVIEKMKNNIENL